MRRSPTIVELKPDGKIRTFFNRITRTHLFMIGFIFLGLLSFTLLITVIRQAQNDQQNDKYCLTEGCLSAATYQLNSINITASSNLCTDFYTYACGGWQKTHPIQSFDIERTVLGDTINQRDIEIKRLLNAPISRINPKSWEYKLKTYYSECLDDYARQPNSGRYMIGLIQDSGTIDGWFVFDNSAKNDSQEFLLKNQSIYTQMSVIHGTLGVTVLFGIRTRFNDTNRNVKRLEFFPAGLSMEINDYLGNDTVSEGRRGAFQIYIIDVLNHLAQESGVTDENLSNRIITVANDVLTIERYLAESLQRNPSATKPRTMTLNEMSEKFSFNFIELVNPNLLSNSTIIYLTNPIYFTDTFELLSKTNDPIFARMIHNYFRWHFVSTYIDDLSYNYIHIHREFLHRYSYQKIHLTNKEYCRQEIQRKFPIAMERLYTINSNLLTIQTILNLLKDEFKESMNQNDALTIAIDYARIASNDTLLDEYYEKLIVNDESHFQNAYMYQRFYQSKLTNPNIFDHWDLFQIRTISMSVVNSQWPWSMNIGSIGVLLAQKLFASINNSEDIAALRLAYNTLKKTNNPRKSFQMPGTNLTNDQTFFLAYAQTQCYQRQKSEISDQRTALNTALIHMPEFAKVFQCK